MDLSNLIPSTDNLFKFLATGGIVLFIISMMYPLEKEREIRLEENKIQNEIEILQLNQNKLLSRIETILSKVRKENNLLDSLELIKSDSAKHEEIESTILEKQIRLNEKYTQLKVEKYQLDIKKINIQSHKEKINVLKEFSDTYNTYFKSSLIIGAFMAIIGLIGWIAKTYYEMKKTIRES